MSSTIYSINHQGQGITLTGTITTNTTAIPATYIYPTITTTTGNSTVYNQQAYYNYPPNYSNNIYSISYTPPEPWDCPLCQKTNHYCSPNGLDGYIRYHFTYKTCQQCQNYLLLSDVQSTHSNTQIYIEKIKLSSSAYFSRTKLKHDYADCYIVHSLPEGWTLDQNASTFAEENFLFLPITKYPELNTTDYSQILEITNKLLILI